MPLSNSELLAKAFSESKTSQHIITNVRIFPASSKPDFDKNASNPPLSENESWMDLALQLEESGMKISLFAF